MSLHQAVRGFELWFGIRPEVTPERRALVEADLLRKRERTDVRNKTTISGVIRLIVAIFCAVTGSGEEIIMFNLNMPWRALGAAVIALLFTTAVSAQQPLVSAARSKRPMAARSH